MNTEIDNGGDSSTTFEIHVSKISDPNNFVPLTLYDGVATTYSIPDASYTVTSGDVFFFKIRAVNSRGNGEFS